MGRLFKRAEVVVPGGITVETRGLMGRKMKRIEVHTVDLSIEGACLRLPGPHKFAVSQPLAFDLGEAHNTLAVVCGCEKGQDWTILRLRFIDPGQNFLSQLVPILKSPGVSDNDVSSWAG